jgi:hypothetical protein
MSLRSRNDSTPRRVQYIPTARPFGSASCIFRGRHRARQASLSPCHKITGRGARPTAFLRPRSSVVASMRSRLNGRLRGQAGSQSSECSEKHGPTNPRRQGSIEAHCRQARLERQRINNFYTISDRERCQKPLLTLPVPDRERCHVNREQCQEPLHREQCQETLLTSPVPRQLVSVHPKAIGVSCLRHHSARWRGSFTGLFGRVLPPSRSRAFTSAASVLLRRVCSRSRSTLFGLRLTASPGFYFRLCPSC